MTANNRQRARQLFMELADLPRADQTAALSRLCGNDTTLRAEVEALLRAEMQAGGFMASPTSPASRSDPDAATMGVTTHERVGAQIGRYKLLQQIGEGGFGVVYMAEQREPVGIDFAADYIERTPAEVLNPPELIDGADLQSLGLPPGPQFKEILTSIRDAQLNEQVTTPDEAIALARKLAGGE